MTAQGHPRVQFRRAVERGNVLIADTTAREFALTLDEALQLVLLYAAYEPAKLERAGLRWFRRWLDESDDVTVLNAQIVLAALARLGRSDTTRRRRLFRPWLEQPLGVRVPGE